MEKKYLRTMIKDTSEVIEDSKEFPLAKTNLKKIINQDLFSIYQGLRPQEPRFRIDIPDIEITTNEESLIRVLRNLVKNAIVATEGKTNITIDCKPAKANLILAVTNTNSRIPEEIIEKVFSPYFTTGAKSLGLGLYICRSVVEKMGGKIAATNLDAAVRFDIELPLG